MSNSRSNTATGKEVATQCADGRASNLSAAPKDASAGWRPYTFETSIEGGIPVGQPPRVASAPPPGHVPQDAGTGWESMAARKPERTGSSESMPEAPWRSPEKQNNALYSSTFWGFSGFGSVKPSNLQTGLRGYQIRSCSDIQPASQLSDDQAGNWRKIPSMNAPGNAIPCGHPHTARMPLTEPMIGPTTLQREWTEKDQSTLEMFSNLSVQSAPPSRRIPPLSISQPNPDDFEPWHCGESSARSVGSETMPGALQGNGRTSTPLYKAGALGTPVTQTAWCISPMEQSQGNRVLGPHMAASVFPDGTPMSRGGDNVYPRIWAPIPNRSVAEVARSDMVRTPSPAFESTSAASSPARARSASQFSSVSLPEAPSATNGRAFPASRSAWSAPISASASWKSAEDLWDQRGGCQGTSILDGFSRSPRAPMSVSSLSSSSSSMAVASHFSGNTSNDAAFARGVSLSDGTALRSSSITSTLGKNGAELMNAWGTPKLRNPDQSSAVERAQRPTSKAPQMREDMAHIVDRVETNGSNNGERRQQQAPKQRDRAPNSPRYRSMPPKGRKDSHEDELSELQDGMNAQQPAPRSWGSSACKPFHLSISLPPESYPNSRGIDDWNPNTSAHGPTMDNVFRGGCQIPIVSESSAPEPLWYLPDISPDGMIASKQVYCSSISTSVDARYPGNVDTSHVDPQCVSFNCSQSHSTASPSTWILPATTGKGSEAPWRQAVTAGTVLPLHPPHSIEAERACQATRVTQGKTTVPESFGSSAIPVGGNDPNLLTLIHDYASTQPGTCSNRLTVQHPQPLSAHEGIARNGGDGLSIPLLSQPAADGTPCIIEKPQIQPNLPTSGEMNTSGSGGASKIRNGRRCRTGASENDPNSLRTGPTPFLIVPPIITEPFGPKTPAEGFVPASGPPAAAPNLVPASPLRMQALDIGPNSSVATSIGMTGNGPYTPVSGRSMLLDQFRAALLTSDEVFNTWRLADIGGHVVEFSTDQHGSRFIQTKLETASTVEVEAVLQEVLADLNRLVTDVFGNYVVQKLLEHGTTRDLQAIAAKLKNRILPLSLHMYGCRAVQKALEVLPADAQAELVAELDGHVLKCIRDQNGNHVVQKCIERVPGPHVQFIVDAVCGQAVSLAEHSYGCRVIQRILEYSSEEQKAPIMREIMQACRALIRDQYGNYVIQHVVEHGKEEERGHILRLVREQCVSMSQHKYASNVVERCLQFGSPADREALIDILLGQAQTTCGNASVPLVDLVQDQFGNYVVQRVLDVANEEQRNLATQLLRANMGIIKRYSYGKHIISRLENASLSTMARDQHLHIAHLPSQQSCSKRALSTRSLGDIAHGWTRDQRATPTVPSSVSAPADLLRPASGASQNAREQDTGPRNHATSTSYAGTPKDYPTSATTERSGRVPGRSRRQARFR